MLVSCSSNDLLLCPVLYYIGVRLPSLLEIILVTSTGIDVVWMHSMFIAAYEHNLELLNALFCPLVSFKCVNI